MHRLYVITLVCDAGLFLCFDFGCGSGGGVGDHDGERECLGGEGERIGGEGERIGGEGERVGGERERPGGEGERPGGEGERIGCEGERIGGEGEPLFSWSKANSTSSLEPTQDDSLTRTDS